MLRSNSGESFCPLKGHKVSENGNAEIHRKYRVSVPVRGVRIVFPSKSTWRALDCFSLHEGRKDSVRDVVYSGPNKVLNKYDCG